MYSNVFPQVQYMFVALFEIIDKGREVWWPKQEVRYKMFRNTETDKGGEEDDTRSIMMHLG